MGVTFNVIAIFILLYMSFLNYNNYNKSMKACGDILHTARIGGKTFIIAGVVLLVLYPIIAFSNGVVFNSETITSIVVLVVVLFSFIVTYKTSSLYFTQNGIVMRGVLYEYYRVKQYKIVDNAKKAAISLTVRDHKDKEANYYFKFDRAQMESVEKIMDKNVRGKKKKKK